MRSRSTGRRSRVERSVVVRWCRDAALGRISAKARVEDGFGRARARRRRRSRSRCLRCLRPVRHPEVGGIRGSRSTDAATDAASHARVDEVRLGAARVGAVRVGGVPVRRRDARRRGALAGRVGEEDSRVRLNERDLVHHGYQLLSVSGLPGPETDTSGILRPNARRSPRFVEIRPEISAATDTRRPRLKTDGAFAEGLVRQPACSCSTRRCSWGSARRRRPRARRRRGTSATRHTRRRRRR